MAADLFCSGSAQPPITWQYILKYLLRNSENCFHYPTENQKQNEEIYVWELSRDTGNGSNIPYTVPVALLPPNGCCLDYIQTICIHYSEEGDPPQNRLYCYITVVDGISARIKLGIVAHSVRGSYRVVELKFRDKVGHPVDLPATHFLPVNWFISGPFY